jgi:hypothetical protein
MAVYGHTEKNSIKPEDPHKRYTLSQELEVIKECSEV